MVEILKTVEWKDCKNVLLHFAREKLNASYIATPNDFCEFLMVNPLIEHQDRLKNLKEWLMTEPFCDVTEKVLAAENITLFVPEPEDQAAVLEIVVEHSLKEDITSWHYLDCQHKAVVKFQQLAGIKQPWIFCENNRNFSAAHLIEVDNQLKLIPVVFVKDLTLYRLLADMMKKSYLRDYLPSHTGDLLSKKRHHSQDKEFEINAHKSGIDNGDSL